MSGDDLRALGDRADPLRTSVARLGPDDMEALARRRLDVLVSHEAPTSHPFGFAAIDDLASRTGAKLVVHGHQHRSVEARLRDATHVGGLGTAEPSLLRRQRMPDRYPDEEWMPRHPCTAADPRIGPASRRRRSRPPARPLPGAPPSCFSAATGGVYAPSMADPFFAALRADGWRVPAKQRIAYRTFHEWLPGGGVQVKIRVSLGDAEWQISHHPRLLGRRGFRPVVRPYVRAASLDDALRDALAEAVRIAARFRASAAHVRLSTTSPPRAAHVPTSTRPPPDPAHVLTSTTAPPPPADPHRNAYRAGKRTVTVVLEPALHARLMSAALDRGTTLQALMVAGAEMVLAAPD